MERRRATPEDAESILRFWNDSGAILRDAPSGVMLRGLVGLVHEMPAGRLFLYATGAGTGINSEARELRIWR
jgi:hypothetical protein